MRKRNTIKRPAWGPIVEIKGNPNPKPILSNIYFYYSSSIKAPHNQLKSKNNKRIKLQPYLVNTSKVKIKTTRVKLLQ